jgi:hypothetical protein
MPSLCLQGCAVLERALEECPCLPSTGAGRRQSSLREEGGRPRAASASPYRMHSRRRGGKTETEPPSRWEQLASRTVNVAGSTKKVS